MRLHDLTNVFYSPWGLAVFTAATTKILQVALTNLFRVQNFCKPLFTRITALPGGQFFLDWGPTILTSFAILIKTLSKKNGKPDSIQPSVTDSDESDPIRAIPAEPTPFKSSSVDVNSEQVFSTPAFKSALSIVAKPSISIPTDLSTVLIEEPIGVDDPIRTGKNGQIIDSIKEKTVSNLFGQEPFKVFKNKFRIIQDLLNGIKTFHFNYITHSSTKPVFYGDIKISNVLVFYESGIWRAKLRDFIGAIDPSTITWTQGYTPPEYVKFFQKHFPHGIDQPSDTTLEKIKEFQLCYGIDRDLWAVGLVILSILVGREELCEQEKEGKTIRLAIAPLPCLKKHLEQSNFKEEGILKINQYEIDKDLRELKKEVYQMHPERAFYIDFCFYFLEFVLQVDFSRRHIQRWVFNVYYPSVYETYLS